MAHGSLPLAVAGAPPPGYGAGGGWTSYAGGGRDGAGRLRRQRPQAGWVISSSSAIFPDLDPPLPTGGEWLCRVRLANDPFSSYPDPGSSPQDPPFGLFSPNTWNLTHSP